MMPMERQIDRWFSWRAPTLKLDSVSTNGPTWSQLAPVNFSNPVPFTKYIEVYHFLDFS